MMISGSCRIALLCGLAMALPALPAHAEDDYPTRTITIAVPLSPGTGMDVLARFYAEGLSKALGQPVVIENQPGAALRRPVQNLARAKPDGYTLAIATPNVLTINPVLYKKLSYDPKNDFVPIALYVRSPFVMVVNSALGVETMKDFIKQAQHPAKTTYATSGRGTLLHLLMESLKRDLRFDAKHVAYRNSNQIVTDIVGGHIDSSLSETGAALPLITGGKLKALAVTSSSRIPSLPEVPTMAEALGMPGFEAVAWHVLLAPAKTPRPIVERLHTEMQRIASDPAFQKRVLKIGLLPAPPRSIEEIKQYIEDQRVRWGGMVTKLGLAGSR